MDSPPVFANILHIAGDERAVRATEAGLDATFIVEVAGQVHLAHVSPVAASSRTFIFTSGHEFGTAILIVRGSWTKGVGFVTAASVLGSFRGLRGHGGRLLFFCNE